MPPKAASPPAAGPSHGFSRCWLALLAATAASSTSPPPRCRGILSALSPRPCLLAVPAHLQGDRHAGASPTLWTRHTPTRSLARAEGASRLPTGGGTAKLRKRAVAVAAHFRSFLRVSENGAPTQGLGGARRCSPGSCGFSLGPLSESTS